ncbi:MAG: cupin domain-containing protein [Thermoplasmata archaeon]
MVRDFMAQLSASVGDVEAVEMREGIVRRTLVYGEGLMLVHWSIREGTVFGAHTHPFEQAGYVLKGKIRMIIGGRATELTPGSSYLVPAGVEHDAVAEEDLEILDVFAHPREEYLP